jgi:hypothetical protein
MRRATCSVLLLGNLLGAGFGFSQPAQASTRPASLCQAPEVTHFTCQTSAKKTISLCSAGDKSLQYRFGKPQAVELQFPKEISEGAQKFKYAHYFRPQTDYWELRFTNNDVSYTLFERWADGKKSAGVEVKLATDKDGTEKQITCVGRFVSKLEVLKTIVPCDTDSALNLGGCPVK